MLRSALGGCRDCKISTDAPNGLKVGRGSKGCEAPLVDGMVPRKGSTKAPFLVSGDARLHEMVMGVSGEQERALDWGCNGQTVRVGSWGAIAPDRVQRRGDGGIQSAQGWSGRKGQERLCSMGAGRAKSPASDGTTIRSAGVRMAQCRTRAMARGMQRESAASPLPRWRYYTAHLAFSQTSTAALPFKGSGSGLHRQMQCQPVADDPPHIVPTPPPKHEALPLPTAHHDV